MERSATQSTVLTHYLRRPPARTCSQMDLQQVARAESLDTASRVSDISSVIQERNRPLFEDAVLAIFQSTFDGRVIAANSAFAQMFGYSDPAEVMTLVQNFGRDLYVRPEQSAEIAQLILRERVIRGFEVSYRRKDGSVFVGNLHIWAVKDAEGRICCLEGCIEDITERKAMEEQLLYLCTHDALTGLYNRWYFEQEMERLERGRQFPISILVADIDDLKLVNDREGHVVGDQLLRQAARLLLDGCRSDDIVARTGGDEFAVLLPHADAISVERIVMGLRNALRSQKATPAGSTLGLAFGIAAVRPGEKLIDAFHRADLKMYQDKARRADARQA